LVTHVERGPVVLDVPGFHKRVARVEIELATGEIPTMIL
jgi:hypothetical protein